MLELLRGGEWALEVANEAVEHAVQTGVEEVDGARVRHKDFASSIGPCIATPDEFDRDNAKLTARVDGQTWSTGVLGNMHFSFEQIIEYTSQEATLQPGDLLSSGTVGKGCGLELGRWLTEGCTVELEAEGIWVLRNRVAHRG